MKRHRQRDRTRGFAIELTPMIDVVFLLIIFFMTTAQFSRLTRADVDLPQERGEQRQTPEEAGIVINITRNGELIVSNRSVDLRELEAIVRAQIRRAPRLSPLDLKLMIRADRNAEAARLNQVVTMLTSLGVGSARLATEVPRMGSGR
ncbi:MAG: biopolymer transporter ExbD [Planctomycetes bacterium]|nr:biopolymer transporter ExbD [Planctomycetota bacterium]